MPGKFVYLSSEVGTTVKRLSSTSLIDLLKALVKHNPDMANPLFEAERAGDIHESIADVTLMNEVFSPGEMITLEEGIN